MLPENQIQNIKQQLLSQLEQSNIQNKEEIKQSVISMNAEQLEAFLKQNKLIKGDSSEQNSKTVTASSQQCIFCSIVSGEAQSYKIDENKDSIAVLEINPISKAHSLIIPKEHISSSEKIPQSAFSLSKKIAKKIKTKLKSKDVLISSTNLFGHEIINVLPIYKNETLASPRQQITPEELLKLKKLLEKKQRHKIAKLPKIKKVKEEKLWLPKRIP